jgi:hypothetical protein
MIETLCKQIIDNLGATGLLVVGLYALLYRPLKSIAKSLSRINWELGTIIDILEKEPWRK